MKIRRTLFLIGKIRDNMNNFLISELKKRGIKGLVPSHGAILAALYKNNKTLTMKEISKWINKSQSTVTVLVDKLCKFGYVKKIQDVNDNRTTNVEITEKGQSFEKPFKEISILINEKLQKNLTKDEADLLENLLIKIVES